MQLPWSIASSTRAGQCAPPAPLWKPPPAAAPGRPWRSAELLPGARPAGWRPAGAGPRAAAHGQRPAAAALLLPASWPAGETRRMVGAFYQRPLHIALLHVILPSARAWGADPSCGSSGGRPGGPERLGELHALGDARSRQGYTLPPPTRYPPAAPAGDVPTAGIAHPPLLVSAPASRTSRRNGNDPSVALCDAVGHRQSRRRRANGASKQEGAKEEAVRGIKERVSGLKQ